MSAMMEKFGEKRSNNPPTFSALQLTSTSIVEAEVELHEKEIGKDGWMGGWAEGKC